MPDFDRLYLLMFNAATDAIELLDMNRADLARQLLIAAQQQSEEIYIREDTIDFMEHLQKKKKPE